MVFGDKLAVNYGVVDGYKQLASKLSDQARSLACLLVIAQLDAPSICQQYLAAFVRTQVWPKNSANLLARTIVVGALHCRLQ